MLSIDADSLSACRAREALFRDDRGDFILYLADGKPPAAREERVLRLGLREALIWLNEPPLERGSFWG